MSDSGPGRAPADELHGFLRELTRFMLRFSGEGAEGVDRVVRGLARTYGGRAETVLVADGAVLSVTVGEGGAGAGGIDRTGGVSGAGGVGQAGGVSGVGRTSGLDGVGMVSGAGGTSGTGGPSEIGGTGAGEGRAAGERVGADETARERAVRKRIDGGQAAQERTDGEQTERASGSGPQAAREQTGGEQAVRERTGGEQAAQERTGGERTLTSVVSAFPDLPRLDRAFALKAFVERLREERPPLGEAMAGLRRIEAMPGRVPPWARLLGIVLFALGFAPAVQPTWYEIGSTALLAGLVAVLTVLSETRPRLARVLPLLAATLVSLVTLGLLQPGHAHGGPVLIMLPALFFFVPGDLLSAAAAELVGGFLSTGAVRLVYALVLLLQLYVGVLLGVAVTGTPTGALFDTAQDADLSRWVVVGSWAVFTAGLVLAFGVPWRAAGWVTALVFLTLGAQAAVTALIGEVGGTFVAAVALAATADLLSRPPGRPPRLVLFLGGFFTLTAGSLGLRALTSLSGGHVLHGFHDLMDFVTVVMTIAVGLLAGAALVPSRAEREFRDVS
ncbi:MULTISPECIES: threonine/serine exporter ThrE family protein [unclassified Streptomyces]|uniref:threonine/serine ThrE exporter family protein n=1 Tax=unclassified Streptomyces TaxID=2593676 RepID=UPI0037FD322D